MYDFFGFRWDEVMKKNEEMRELYPISTRIVVEYVSGYMPDQTDDAKPRVIQNGDRGWVTRIGPFANVYVLFDGGHVEVVHPLFDSFRKLTEKELFEERKTRTIDGVAAGQVFYDQENKQFFALSEKEPDGSWIVQDMTIYGEPVGARSVSAEALAVDVLNNKVSSLGTVELRDSNFRFNFIREYIGHDGFEMSWRYKGGLHALILDAERKCAGLNKDKDKGAVARDMGER